MGIKGVGSPAIHDEKSESEVEDVKVGSFFKPKNVCGRASEDERWVQTNISCSPFFKGLHF